MKREAEFIKKVRTLAVSNNMSATAKALKIPVYTLKARLLSAAIKLGEIPPQFAKKRATKKVSKAIKTAQKSKKPTLISCKTKIGYGSPNKAGTAATHGSPLGEDEIAATRESLKWPYSPFEIVGLFDED